MYIHIYMYMYMCIYVSNVFWMRHTRTLRRRALCDTICIYVYINIYLCTHMYVYIYDGMFMSTHRSIISLIIIELFCVVSDQKDQTGRGVLGRF